MKLKFSIQKKIELQPKVVEEKVDQYLKSNFYRVIERGHPFILFVDDEYSDRKVSRSDFHTRIEEGKFEILSENDTTIIKLIYLTPITYPIFLIMLFSAFGIYANSITPMFISFVFILPVLYRIYYLKEYVFNEIFKKNI